jgi:hypothetical protein
MIEMCKLRYAITFENRKMKSFDFERVVKMKTCRLSFQV